MYGNVTPINTLWRHRCSLVPPPEDWFVFSQVFSGHFCTQWEKGKSGRPAWWLWVWLLWPQSTLDHHYVSSFLSHPFINFEVYMLNTSLLAFQIWLEGQRSLCTEWLLWDKRLYHDIATGMTEYHPNVQDLQSTMTLAKLWKVSGNICLSRKNPASLMVGPNSARDLISSNHIVQFLYIHVLCSRHSWQVWLAK